MKKLMMVLITSTLVIPVAAQDTQVLHAIRRQEPAPAPPITPPGILTIQGAMNVEQYQLVELILVGPPIDSAAWDIIKASDITYVVSKTIGNEKGTRIIFTGPPDTYRVTAWASSNNKVMNSVITVTIKGTPTPPTPEPTPPNPQPPQPTASCIPDQGLRVLMVYESEDLSKYPRDQMLVLYSTDLRQYLNSACTKINNIPEWRIADKDINLSNESTIWQNALKCPRQSLPWIIISNGVTEFSGPVPVNTTETINLIKKYDPAITPPQTIRYPARRAA